MAGTPARVLRARYGGDTEALRAMGSAGGKASGRKRRHEAVERDVLSAIGVIESNRRTEEAFGMIAERGGDPND